MRSFSLVLPCSSSQVHLTSRAVKGLPSCHLTPSCSLKGQPRAVLVPCPALGQLGDDRLHAILLHMLVIQDEVVEHCHYRSESENRDFLMDRHARRAVDRVGLQDPAVFLCVGGIEPCKC